jgi:hypothetical protein
MNAFEITEAIIVTHNGKKYKLDSAPLQERKEWAGFIGRRLDWMGKPSGVDLIVVVFEGNKPHRILATFVNSYDAQDGLIKYMAQR